jgi:hypothetical protein
MIEKGSGNHTLVHCEKVASVINCDYGEKSGVIDKNSCSHLSA